MILTKLTKDIIVEMQVEDNAENQIKKDKPFNNFVNGNYRNYTWQTISPIRVKRADVRAFVATGYFARRSKYL